MKQKPDAKLVLVACIILATLWSLCANTRLKAVSSTDQIPSWPSTNGSSSETNMTLGQMQTYCATYSLGSSNSLSEIASQGLSAQASARTNLGMASVPLLLERVRAQADATGNYTWTFPTAFGAGVVPIISVVSETSSATIPQGVQIIGIPSSTNCVFKVIALPSTSVLGITVIGVPAGAQAFIDCTAVSP